MGLPKSVIGADKWVRYGASSKGTRRLLFESYGRRWNEAAWRGVREREEHGVRVARWPVHYHNRIPLREGPPDTSTTVQPFTLTHGSPLTLTARNIADNFLHLLLVGNCAAGVSTLRIEYSGSRKKPSNRDSKESGRKERSATTTSIRSCGKVRVISLREAFRSRDAGRIWNPSGSKTVDVGGGVGTLSAVVSGASLPEPPSTRGALCESIAYYHHGRDKIWLNLKHKRSALSLRLCIRASRRSRR